MEKKCYERRVSIAEMQSQCLLPRSRIIIKMFGEALVELIYNYFSFSQLEPLRSCTYVFADINKTEVTWLYYCSSLVSWKSSYTNIGLLLELMNE
jgi:hypothetical protein